MTIVNCKRTVQKEAAGKILDVKIRDDPLPRPEGLLQHEATLGISEYPLLIL